MKLLIACDGSTFADAAIDDLERAGLPPEGEALLVSIADVWLEESPLPDVEAPHSDHVSIALAKAREAAVRELERSRTIARRASERLARILPRWSLECEAHADSPAWGVLKTADRFRPDLIVTGSQGKGALARWVLGSVSQKILAEAPCSVRIGRPRESRPPGPIKLLIGIDGSEGAARAVSAMARRRWPAGTEARILAVIDDAIMTPLDFLAQPMSSADRSWLSDALVAADRELAAAGVRSSSEIRSGPPKSVLVEEAASMGADAIIVGARGLRRVERFLLGSVSAGVANAARCTVEVVRA